jgi:hypothetical protein
VYAVTPDTADQFAVKPLDKIVVAALAVGAVGVPLTVTVVVLLHPESVYVITEVPADTPDTTPEAAFTVATPVDPLLQVPPDGFPVKVVVELVHTFVVPVTVGVSFTVIVASAEEAVHGELLIVHVTI